MLHNIKRHFKATLRKENFLSLVNISFVFLFWFLIFIFWDGVSFVILAVLELTKEARLPLKAQMCLPLLWLKMRAIMFSFNLLKKKLNFVLPCSPLILIVLVCRHEFMCTTCAQYLWRPEGGTGLLKLELHMDVDDKNWA